MRERTLGSVFLGIELALRQSRAWAILQTNIKREAVHVPGEFTFPTSGKLYR